MYYQYERERREKEGRREGGREGEKDGRREGGREGGRKGGEKVTLLTELHALLFSYPMINLTIINNVYYSSFDVVYLFW